MAHAAVAVAAGQWYPRARRLRFWWTTAICAMLPDADVIGFAFGVRYGSLLGHRGLSHSLCFAAVAGVVASIVVVGRQRGGPHPGGEAPAGRGTSWGGVDWRLAAYFAAVTASHGLLDALTNGGLGVAFFAPFDATRYFLPWRPIQVSPIGTRFLSPRGVAVLLNEAVWLFVPALLIAAGGRMRRGWRRRGELA